MAPGTASQVCASVPKPPAARCTPARPEGGFASVPNCRWRAVIRVLLADDQALIRAGFRVFWTPPHDIEVVGEAENGAPGGHARPRAPRRRRADGYPHAWRRWPGGHSPDGADENLAGVKVLILTTFESDEYVYEALRAGASGFLVKDTEPEELLHAIRVVARGDALLSPGHPSTDRRHRRAPPTTPTAIPRCPS